MEIDLSVYLKAATAGVPLLLLVFGIVEILKRLKKADGSPSLTGNAILLASLAWGEFLGLAYWMATTEPPQPGAAAWPIYVYWFTAVAYGLGLGILAAIFFEAIKVLIHRAVARIMTGSIPPTPPANSPSEGMD